jgi:hypothetical protein
MDLIFHYYTVYYLAREAGLESGWAERAAFSSQLVDAGVVRYAVRTEGGVFETPITQTYTFWDPVVGRDVYFPFHFFPGGIADGSGERADGATNASSCTPNSPGVKELLREALQTGDPYRIGIGLHTFADSWAHQHFSGLMERWNAVGESSLLPPVGHAQALSAPDKVGQVWNDPRLVPGAATIRNNHRFLAAAKKIYRYLCVFNRRTFEDEELVLHRLREIYETTDPSTEFVLQADVPPYDHRAWMEAAMDLEDDDLPQEVYRGYDKMLWLKDQLLYKSKLAERRQIQAKPGFYRSDYYQFCRAAEAHRRVAQAIITRVTASAARAR